MDINDCHEIKDLSPETFRWLSDLIEASHTDEQMVYREAELDELWRMLHTHKASADGADPISRMIAVVTEVHDIIGLSIDPAVARAAAQRLRDCAP